MYIAPPPSNILKTGKGQKGEGGEEGELTWGEGIAC
jgi:hypothetical protein